MKPSPHPPLAATLRPLEEARASLSELAHHPIDSPQRRDHFARAVNGVEAALRRWLRDDSGAALPVRLSALAPDELAVDRLIGELRQRNRISVELAAGFHELWVRTRAPEAAPAIGEREVEALRGVVRKTEQEISAAPLPAPGAAELGGREHDAVPIHAVPPEGRTGVLPAAPWALLFAVLLALLLAAALWWSLWQQRPGAAPLQNRGRAEARSEPAGALPDEPARQALPFSTPAEWI